MGEVERGPSGGSKSLSLLTLTLLTLSSLVCSGGDQALELGLGPPSRLLLLTPSTPSPDNPLTYKISILNSKSNIRLNVNLKTFSLPLSLFEGIPIFGHKSVTTSSNNIAARGQGLVLTFT